jgi:hypothetical protein
VNEILLGTYGQVSCTGSYCCNDFQLFGWWFICPN